MYWIFVVLCDATKSINKALSEKGLLEQSVLGVSEALAITSSLGLLVVILESAILPTLFYLVALIDNVWAKAIVTVACLIALASSVLLFLLMAQMRRAAEPLNEMAS